MNRRLLLGVPFAMAAAGGFGFYAMLRAMQRGNFDPRGVPSQLIDKPLPDFALPGFSRADVLARKAPVVINFFASWCVPCIEEAPILSALQKQGVPIWGIAYKDKPPATDQFLKRRGNPYEALARDEDGTVGIEWGVTGVPETYLIDAQGVVRWRFTGPLSTEAAKGLAQMLAHA
jgi:cytochrome c biogenesis protein CcmG/thiol:disulfide interchange protein DsbE